MSLNKPSHSLPLPHSSTLLEPSAFRAPHSRPSRYTPYPQRQYSIHQLNITYLDPDYVQSLVEIAMPEHPAEGLAALLIPPPRGFDEFLAEYVDLGYRLMDRAVAVVIDLVVGFRRANRGRA